MKKLLFFVFLTAAVAVTKANNIQITNVSVVPANSTIKFDVSWDNSWRSSVLNNWDAAWIFFKYKDLSGDWVHLELTNLGNAIPAGFTSTIIPSSSGLWASGAFLYRATAGSGTSSLTNVELGIAAAQASGIFDIKAFAIEMVYIPQATFYAGDVSSTNSYYVSGSPNTSAIIGSSASSLTDPLASPAVVNSTTFPNGYSAFYCMKYELSMGGYRDFLNTLNYTQQIPHIVPAPSSIAGTYALYNANRNNIKIKTPGVASSIPAVFGCDANNNNVYDEASDGEWIACNYLNWVDHAAYLAWAGLRPLTELEYEKAARGIQLPVAGEYAWGNTQISTIISVLTNPNQSSEIVSNSSPALGNANYVTTYPNAPNTGPLRNGIFATATSNRITSGGSFFGVMELSGSLWERVVTTATLSGQSYTNVYANSNLTPTGFAQQFSIPFTWPGQVTPFIGGIINATGLMYRGGGWQSSETRLRTSDRAGLLITNTNTDRTVMQEVGVRGCRTPN